MCSWGGQAERGPLSPGLRGGSQAITRQLSLVCLLRVQVSTDGSASRQVSSVLTVGPGAAAASLCLVLLLLGAWS